MFFTYNFIYLTDNFTYLGSTIASNNSSLNDVNRRIAIATSTKSNLSSLWTSFRLSLALKMRLYNSLIISIITYSSASWTLSKAQKETPRCLQHKSPPPHSGCPLVRLCHERINSYPYRTTTPNDNNPQSTSKCLRTNLPSANRHSSHRHYGLHPIFIMAPPKRTSTTPRGRPYRERHPDVTE